MAIVRPADLDDFASIVAIYNDAVAESVATFDETRSTVDDRSDWFRQFSTSGPHRLLVATDGAQGGVLGYAGSMPYRHHTAFSETVELTIYLSSSARGHGVGSKLYDALFAALSDEIVHCVVAGIALPNEASVALHRHFRFSDVGVFRQYAQKNDQRIDSLWMQRLMSDT